MNRSSKPLFDKKPLYDDDWIYDSEPCPICKEAVSEHNQKQAVDCALAVIKGGRKN